MIKLRSYDQVKIGILPIKGERCRSNGFNANEVNVKLFLLLLSHGEYYLERLKPQKVAKDLMF